MEYKDPKRKHFRAECAVDSTYEDNAPRFMLGAMANLPLLPDDVLLCIMKYLGPVELHNLSRITERLGHLASNKSLWKTVDFRPHKLTSSQLSKYVNYFKESTKFLAVRGFASEAANLKQGDGVLAPKLLELIFKKCPELETLILDEHFGPACMLHIQLFPSTICHLSMRDCVITDLNPQNSYFHDMRVRFPYLKVLILSNCKWVSPHDFMAISKCYRLEELRMDGCLQLGECVPYASLAARCGFYSLKILDLRNTRMGDSDVTCFSHSHNLTHLYLQCPSTDNEVRDGLCGDPKCVGRDDFQDSSDDDDIDAPTFIEDGHCTYIQPGLPPLPMNTLPALSERCRCLVETRSNPSTVCSLASHTKRDENGDPYLPQASTSYGGTNIVLNPPGPSHTGQKVGSPKKHPLGDSDSSSDENFSSFIFPISGSEMHKQTWTSEEGSRVPTSQASCISVSEAGSRGKKHRHPSSDHSLTSDEPSTSKHSFIESPGCSVNDMNSKLQDGDSLCQKPRTLSDSSSGSTEEVNCRQESDVSKTDSSEQGRNLRADDSSCGPFDVSARSRFHILDRCCPHLFHSTHHESTTESLISDVCTMAFVLNEHESDESGYVRIVSPHAVSARAQLHTLVVKNYRKITDKSLRCLLRLNSLRYLDVSGTSVTKRGVLEFKLKRPDVEVISDHRELPI